MTLALRHEFSCGLHLCHSLTTLDPHLVHMMTPHKAQKRLSNPGLGTNSATVYLARDAGGVPFGQRATCSNRDMACLGQPNRLYEQAGWRNMAKGRQMRLTLRDLPASFAHGRTMDDLLARRNPRYLSVINRAEVEYV